MVLKIFTLIIFLAWIAYWQIQERRTYKEKPLTKEKLNILNLLGRIFIRVIFLLVIIQLLGVHLFPVTQSVVVFQAIGAILICVGIVMSVSARMTLASNWSNGYEYQIKKGQELVTSGIYGFIRHPIYAGMTFMLIGAEMVCGSWLWMSFLALFIGAYFQGKREEKILLVHFGKKYQEYMRHTKMLIPYLI